MTPEEIYNIITSENVKDEIIYVSERDSEKPLGVVITWIKDRFNYAKVDAYPIAEKICKFYGLL